MTHRQTNASAINCRREACVAHHGSLLRSHPGERLALTARMLSIGFHQCEEFIDGV